MGVPCRRTRDFSKVSANKINNLRKSGYPGIFRRAENIFRKKYHATGTVENLPKNKCHCLLADPPGVGIPKSSEDVKKKGSNRRLFRQLPSHSKTTNKIYKVFSLGHGSWVWARIAQTFPVTPKRAREALGTR